MIVFRVKQPPHGCVLTAPLTDAKAAQPHWVAVEQLERRHTAQTRSRPLFPATLHDETLPAGPFKVLQSPATPFELFRCSIILQ